MLRRAGIDVFISWSGDRSKYVAERLAVWVKQVIQLVRPWLSSENILAGARWNAEIAKHLAATKFGIICVTPENLTAPWLVFEAGALAKTIDEKTHVCPYLIGLNEIDPQHPLSQFQCKRADKEEETFDVVRSMHKALLASSKEVDLTEAQVKESFQQWYPRLAEQFKKIPSPPGAEEQEPQAEPDKTSEILALMKGVAQSVSMLQAQVASAVSPLGGEFFQVGYPLGVQPGPRPNLFWPGPGERVFTTFDRFGIGRFGERTAEGVSEAEIPEMPEVASGASREQRAELNLVCPNCGKSLDDKSVKGLAQTVDDGNASHLGLACKHCGVESGVHVSRADKSLRPCPEECPYRNG